MTAILRRIWQWLTYDPACRWALITDATARESEHR